MATEMDSTNSNFRVSNTRANGLVLRVCSFEGRRREEMKSLIERRGAAATVAPAMREVPLDDNPDAFTFAEDLLNGKIDAVIFMTGVGARGLLDVVKTRYDETELLAALNRCTIVVRGPKPAAVLRDWKVRIDHRAAEPNTWREVLNIVTSAMPLKGKRIAVQEYGLPSDELYRALHAGGAQVVRVPVYRWEFPEETGPLMEAIRMTISGDFDVVLFTSAQQLRNVLQAAGEAKLRDKWIAAANRCTVGSIGPTTSQALRDADIEIGVEASPPKMGQLVRQALEAAVNRLKNR